MTQLIKTAPWKLMVSECKTHHVVLGYDCTLLDYSNSDGTVVVATDIFDDAAADLIVDAGNVCAKSGLMPSDLLAQRDELLEALKAMVTIREDAECLPEVKVATHIYAKNLIAKVTGGVK